MLKALRLQSATALAGFVVMALPAHVFAQSVPDAAPSTTTTPPVNNEDTVIIVTGSRIPRPNLDRDQPTTIVSSALINQRGFTTAATALNQLPGFGIADSSSVGDQGSGFGVGQSFVNLYSLGSQRTLTLVDGRRFVGANPASVFSSAGAGTQVDLNVIPTQLIDRIETIGIGGAPIYGSDAIAGTVNFILKRKYHGIDADIQSGISELGDSFNWRGRILAGSDFADGRGNFTAAAEYSEGKGIIGTQRDAIAAQTGFIAPLVPPADPTSPLSQILVSNERTFLGTQGGNPYFIDAGTIGPKRSIVDANGKFVRFAPNGNLVTFNTGTPTNDPTTFLGGDALNLASTTNLAVDSRRFNTAAFFSYDLTDNVHAFVEGWYSKNKATNLAGQPSYNTAFFRQAAPGSFDVNGNFIFQLNNPYLTKQAHDIIQQNLIAQGLPSDDTAHFYVGRANTDLVSGVAKLDQDLYRFVGGLKGEFKLFANPWNWEVSGNYGHTRSLSLTPSLVEPNLRRALTITRDASGNIICAPFNPDPNDPTAPPNLPQYNGTISQTCAPLNLFGQGAPSQAARDYVTTLARTVAITSQRDFVATVGGSLFDLPGGKVGVSLGYENRRELSKFQPDAYYLQALGRSVPINSVEGSYTTNELFGEVRAPLIGPEQHIPLLHSLELNGAVRYVRNSVAGNATTYTGGGRLEPFAGLAIRGNFTRSIRAPAVTELFAANQPAFDGGYDPCDQQNLTSGPNPATRQKNCAAAGLPTNFSSLINTISEPINVVGNRHLQNEFANSWTMGAAFTPRFARRFSFSADYISISLKNTVVSSTARDVLTGCYDATSYPNNYYCSLIKRDTAPDNLGQVLTLDEPYINQGGLTYRAVQAQGDYVLPINSLQMNIIFGLVYQHIIKSYQTISADSGNTNTRGNIGRSVDQANLNIVIEHGPLSLANQIRYIGPAVFDASEPAGTRDVPGVPSYIVLNSSLAIKIDKRATFQINVDNVTNRGVPYPGIGNASQNVYTEGLFGRTYLARFEVKY